MARKDRKSRAKSNQSDARAGDPRRARSIRFSDSEWQLVEDAALCRGIPAGQFVRAVMLAAAEERIHHPDPASISPGHLALIEATYRGVYLLATLSRKALLRASREKDLDEIVEEARKAMRGIMDQGPS